MGIRLNKTRVRKAAERASCDFADRTVDEVLPAGPQYTGNPPTWAGGFRAQALVGDRVSENPIRDLVEKLDNRGRDRDGYVTESAEIIDILTHLTPHISIFVGEETSMYPNEQINVRMKIGFTLDRSEI